MRQLIIKYFALSYNVKLFGINFRYLRAVLPTIFFFCLWGLYTTAQDYRSLSEYTALNYILTVPVLLCFWFGFKWFGLGYFGMNPVKYEDLQDWEQKHQYVNSPEIYRMEDVSEERIYALNGMFNKKYKGPENFVNTFKGIFPWAVLVVTGILAYYIL